MAKVKVNSPSEISGENSTEPIAKVDEQRNLSIVEISTVPSYVATPNELDVVIVVKYPEGYKDKKIIKEGETVVSKESADLFEKKGIAKIK